MLLKYGTVQFYLIMMLLAIIAYKVLSNYGHIKQKEGFCPACLGALMLL